MGRTLCLLSQCVRVASLLAALALTQNSAFAQQRDRETYERWLTRAGDRILVVLRPANEPAEQCRRIDDSSTIFSSAREGASTIISLAYYEGGGSFGYVLWSIDASGAHSVSRANFFLSRCALGEERYETLYFRSDVRWDEASEYYRTLLTRSLSGEPAPR